VTVRLEELLAAATPGPWHVHTIEDDGYGERHDDIRPEGNETIIAYGEGCFLPPEERANLDLIALAPDAVRLLIDMGEALRGMESDGHLHYNVTGALLARLDRLGA